MSSAESVFDRIERIAARLPGFNDYRDLDALRESDRQTRADIAAKLEQTALRIERGAQPLIANQQFAAITQVERLLQSLRLAAVRLESAPQGYAPLFGDRTVDANVLQQVIAFDQALSARADLLSSDADAFIASMASGDDLASGSDSVNRQIETLLGEFARRSTILASGARAAGQPLSSVYGRSEPGLTAVIDLDVGDVVSVDQADFVVEAQLQINSVDAMATGYLLDARSRRWLILAPDSGSPFVLAKERKSSAEIPEEFEPTYSLTGAATLRDSEGRSNLGILTLDMSSPMATITTDQVTIQLTSPKETITLAGDPIEGDAITIYGKPG